MDNTLSALYPAPRRQADCPWMPQPMVDSASLQRGVRSRASPRAVQTWSGLKT